MTAAAAAPAPAAASPAKKRVSKPKAPAAHPTYLVMTQAAIAALKERNGSSRQAILKYIMANYKVGPNTWIETEVSRKRQNLDDKKAGVKKARFDYVGPFRPTAPSPPSYDDVSSF